MLFHVFFFFFFAQSYQNQYPESQPVCIAARPAGTTWIFSDGSQVLASPSKGSNDDDDDKDGELFCCFVVLLFC